MNRRTLNTLIVGDQDLDCQGKNKKIPELENINLSSLGFVMRDLEKYDCIIYQGSRGKKILRLK